MMISRQFSIAETTLNTVWSAPEVDKMTAILKSSKHNLFQIYLSFLFSAVQMIDYMCNMCVVAATKVFYEVHKLAKTDNNFAIGPKQPQTVDTIIIKGL